MSVHSEIDEELDEIDMGDLCASLRKSSIEIGNLYNDTFVQMKVLKKKLREEAIT